MISHSVELIKPHDELMPQIAEFICKQRWLMAVANGLDVTKTERWISESCTVQNLQESLEYRPSGIFVVHVPSVDKRHDSARLIVATAAVNRRPVDKPPEIFALYVDESWRQRGIGKTLLKRAVQLVTTAGFEEVRMEVAHSNNEMLRLAESEGFQITETHKESEIVNWQWTKLQKRLD